MAITAPREISAQFNDYLNSGKALQLQQRLAQLDTALWSDDAAVKATIEQRLGWINCIDNMLEEVPRINKFTDQVHEHGFKHCVLLGMGGSSLAPEAFSQMFSDAVSTSKLSLDVLDNTSPDAINDLAAQLNLQQTLFIVASKSGTTLESDSLYRFFYQMLDEHANLNPDKHFVAITDPGSPLEQIARDKGFFACFSNPADIGGRFSVLSFFGLVPAALVGVDIEQLLTSAKTERTLVSSASQSVSDATQLGIAMGLAAESGLDKLVLKLDQQMVPFAAWLEQLVAESTGKFGTGVVPVIQPYSDSISDQSSVSRFNVSLQQSLEPMADLFTSRIDLAELGAEFFKWEWATAIAGAVMNINPFDEPNVSENKRVTEEVLQQNTDDIAAQLNSSNEISLVFDGSERSREEVTNRLQSLLAHTRESDYLAILAYTSHSQKIESALKNLRSKQGNNYKIVSTYGTGPRYLHSTGQLHKGGDNNGIFLMITEGYLSKAAIPDSPYGFESLNAAQALGDLKVLKARDRRIMHIHLQKFSAGLLASLGQALAEV